MITSFFESKDRRIFKEILLTFSNMINLSRESILSYWIYDEFEYEIFKFIDIEAIISSRHVNNVDIGDFVSLILTWMRCFVLNLMRMFSSDWSHSIVFIWVIDSIVREKIIDWIHDKMAWFESWSWESIWEIERSLKDLYIFEKILREDLSDIRNDK